MTSNRYLLKSYTSPRLHGRYVEEWQRENKKRRAERDPNLVFQRVVHKVGLQVSWYVLPGAELAHGNVRVVGDPNDCHGHPPAAIDHRKYGDQQVEQSGWVLYQSWGIADVDKPKEGVFLWSICHCIDR